VPGNPTTALGKVSNFATSLLNEALRMKKSKEKISDFVISF
jgi:hypothetical protein